MKLICITAGSTRHREPVRVAGIYVCAYYVRVRVSAAGESRRAKYLCLKERG